MKMICRSFFARTGLSLVIFAFSLNAFSQNAVKLEYKYPTGRSFKYVTNTKIVQDMDVNGQSMQVNIGRYMSCEIIGAGEKDGNLNLDVRVDSLSQSVESPQGSAGGPISDVKGREFYMLISPAGKIVDLSGATSIVYSVEGTGETDLGQEFYNYFPSLPPGDVKPGDIWATNDTVNSKSASGTMWMPATAEYTFEGVENVDGTDCARISATITGTRKMTTFSQGMEIHISGPFTGTEELLFALKDGYFIKQTVNTKMTGNIEITDQGMTFPVVMNVNSSRTLIK